MQLQAFIYFWFCRFAVIFSHKLEMMVSVSGFPTLLIENIFSLSIAWTLSAVFREWHFASQTVDHGIPTETCHLCDKEGLRYDFEIRNDQIGYCLDVGSDCILKFEVLLRRSWGLLEPMGIGNSIRT